MFNLSRLQLVIAGKLDRDSIESIRKTDKKLYGIITDPQVKRQLCSDLRKQLSRIKTPAGILSWLQVENLSSFSANPNTRNT